MAMTPPAKASIVVTNVVRVMPISHVNVLEASHPVLEASHPVLEAGHPAVETAQRLAKARQDVRVIHEPVLNVTYAFVECRHPSTPSVRNGAGFAPAGFGQIPAG
jgi:hypothetical protein